MEVTLNGVEELRDAATKFVRTAQVFSDAAQKIDDALAAVIQALDFHASRLEALHAQRLDTGKTKV